MELSAAFEERVRQMEDARNHRLSLLHAEKEIQAAKSRLLGAKIATARRLEGRRLLLERRTADLASRTLSARAVIDATHARRLVVARDLSLVRAEIEEAERKEEDWDRFYESKRKERQQFQAMSQQFEVEAHKEVQMLKDTVSQGGGLIGLGHSLAGYNVDIALFSVCPMDHRKGLKPSSQKMVRLTVILLYILKQLQSTLQESSGMYSNDTDIAVAEARKSDLTSKKAKLDESLASARQFRALLQQQLQKAFASQVGDQKATQN